MSVRKFRRHYGKISQIVLLFQKGLGKFSQGLDFFSRAVAKFSSGLGCFSAKYIKKNKGNHPPRTIPLLLYYKDTSFFAKVQIRFYKN
jgi:hypothetical protein